MRRYDHYTDKFICDDEKVLTVSYLTTASLNHKELLKVIILLIGEYFRESEKA